MGARPADVSAELLREYLVQASEQRLAAYHRYREESFEYWTARELEALHWEALYAMVTLETNAVLGTHRTASAKNRIMQQCRLQRAQFCQAVGIADERVSLATVHEFWQRHQRYARLPWSIRRLL